MYREFPAIDACRCMYMYIHVYIHVVVCVYILSVLNRAYILFKTCMYTANSIMRGSYRECVRVNSVMPVTLCARDEREDCEEEEDVSSCIITEWEGHCCC